MSQTVKRIGCIRSMYICASGAITKNTSVIIGTAAEVSPFVLSGLTVMTISKNGHWQTAMITTHLKDNAH